MFTWWIAGMAVAGSVYVNGTAVDPSRLAGQILQNVSVTVDAQGNVFINAPGFQLGGAAPYPQPQPAYPPSPYPSPYPQPAPYPQPGMGNTGYPAPNGGYPGGGYPAPMGGQQTYPNGIARAHWWLVTDDKGSMGHSVEVYVNGQQVQTVKSGEAQRIIDIGLFLHPGQNNVDCKAFSAQANSGTLYVYLGSGQDQQGTVKMDPPQVQFGVGTNTTYMSNRSYTLNVQ